LSRTACRSRSNVVSRLIDFGSLCVTTGRSSRPCDASCSQAPKPVPKCCRRKAASAAASWPIVSMPSAASLAAAFGPMPLTLRAASGQMRSAMSACVSSVRPSGLSSSDASLDSSLFGVMPIEHVNPVRSRTAALSATPTARPPSLATPGSSLRSI
jgi:hypothetical protein